MARLRLLVLPSALALLFAVGACIAPGCSSDEAGAAGSTTNTTTTGATGSDAGPPTDYCNNDGDEAARARGYCPGNQSIQDISARCGVDCVYEADAGGCISDCLLAGTDGALSEACATCVAATVTCARDYCLSECLSDPESVLCLGCRCGANAKEHNCYDDYEHCAGTHLDDCERLEAGTFDGYPGIDAGCNDGGAGGAKAAGGAGGAGGSGA